MTSLSSAIRHALLIDEPREKIFATRTLVRAWRKGALDPRFDCAMPKGPARPRGVELLPPNRMPKRKAGGALKARVALWHALAHIEYVAIDLALDMAGRFGEQGGREFISDFLGVAADEAMHFALLERKLRTMGSAYGALPAHGGLWEAAEQTAQDVRARLAVVPMVLEARGLDVTPSTLERVRAQGDEHGARILERILADEIRHVAVGTRHFQRLCAAAGEEPADYWRRLVEAHFRGALKPPFNDSARLAAGLSREFYAPLASQ